jgi:hypothetical protein
MVVRLLLCVAVALVAGCTGKPDATPLPTKQTTIDPVVKKLEAAQQQEQRRREAIDEAAK